MQTQTNIFIDYFIENLVNYNVDPKDISDYLDYSFQFESTSDIENKNKILENFFLTLQTQYPNIYEELDPQIKSLYYEVFSTIYDEERHTFGENISKDIIDSFMEYEFSGNFYELGEKFASIAYRYLDEKSRVQFINGFSLGLDSIEYELEKMKELPPTIFDYVSVNGNSICVYRD